jgi:outer membrane protein assembly factor BamB
MTDRNHAHRTLRGTRRPLLLTALAVFALGAGIVLLTRPPAGSLTAAVLPTATLPATAAPAATETAPAATTPVPTTTADPGTAAPSAQPIAAGPFAGGVLIADRANGRILAVGDGGQILWRFPASSAALPAGQAFAADDAFLDPSGTSIVANDETHDVIDRIDIASGRITWQYGTYGRAGSRITQLHTPDDAYPLANGNIVVADIENCRILEIAPDKSIAHQWGQTGVCRHQAGVTFARPNGDTPLPDGGLLVTEIGGSRVVRLSADGRVVFDIHVPVAYPSDAQLDANGNVIVVDYSTHGQVVAVSPTGHLVWRYAPTSGPGALNHPSLATPLANGLVSVNDDFRHRLVVIDPRSGHIVWQYGRTDIHGTRTGYLNTPDGHQPLPAGAFG